jgi:hypothetical protein
MIPVADLTEEALHQRWLDFGADLAARDRELLRAILDVVKAKARGTADSDERRAAVAVIRERAAAFGNLAEVEAHLEALGVAGAGAG